MASKCDSVRNLQSINDASELLHSEMNTKLLKPLDEALRCRICFDYFNNCMITKCSHNYCSVCIRRYMTFKAQCPVCFQDASEPELRNNRLIDEVLRTYIKIKEMLSEAVLPQSKSQSVHLTPVESIRVKIEKESTEVNAGTDEPGETEENIIDDNEVSCPVCYKIVLKDRINIHLDTCLKRTEQYSERKTLPKLVYHLLSDKEIRKKLKEHGLNATGDRQNLIRRHKNFLTLYNANCDSLTPKPVTELVLEIEKQEIEERLNSFPKQIKVHKKSDASEIETEHKLYAKQHQSHFNALLQDIHERHINDETCFSFCDTQKACRSNKVTDKGKLDAEDNDSCIHFDGYSKQETLFIEIVETKSLSESEEKIQDLPTIDNLPSLDDHETEHIKVKQEEQDDCTNIDDETCFSFCDTQKACQSNKVKLDKGKLDAEENDSCIHFDRYSKQDTLSIKIVETKSLSESEEKIQDLPTIDNLPSLDDHETGKITQLNLLRKRKKGKQGSSKKK